MERIGPEIVASDMEGTLSDCEAWRGMRAYLAQNGYEQRFRRFFLRSTPGLLRFRLGWINPQVFKERWILGVLNLFEGFSRADMQAMAEFVVETEVMPHVRTAVLDELRAHQAAGRRVILVTGMFEPFMTAFLAREQGFEAIGTPLQYDGDRFSGRTAAPLNVNERKVAQLQPLTTTGRIVAAYGDTAADIPMLSLADQPVAVHPDAALRTTAVARGWRILE